MKFHQYQRRLYVCIRTGNNTQSLRLALICVMQFIEDLTDERPGEAVRSRIGGVCAGVELHCPSFNFSVLCEFRARLVAGGAEQQLLDTYYYNFIERGWLKQV